MKNIRLVIIAITIGLFSCNTEVKETSKSDMPKTIIFDTDFSPDYDDVGAITLLHAFADSGYVNILATIGSTAHDSKLAPGLDAINTYFGRPDIPIAIPKNSGIFCPCHLKWNDILVKNYPHDIDTSTIKSATILYREILSQQADTSVTIVTVGFLTNLAELLKSSPDEFSPLNGTELVAKKVKKLISMAGAFPSGKEFNVFKDSLNSKYAIDNWPTEIIFSGHEIGSEIKTGLPLIENTEIQNSPIKDIFTHCMTSEMKWPGDENGRSSWDETAVLVACKGYEPYFNIEKGKFITFQNGSNNWESNPNGKHAYLKFKMPKDELTKVINDLMMHQPKKEVAF